jgi:secreted trypsin-like serine protease
LLKTANKIIFTDYVKPVCLPLFNAPVIPVTGYVAGYGKSEENSHHETRPKHVRIRSVNPEICIYNNTVFASIGSLRTFCAGERNRNPCQGDSGGGFYVQKGNRFEINGIVSAAPDDDCGANVFVLFTNVPEFVEWIKEIIGEIRCKKEANCIFSDEEDAE